MLVSVVIPCRNAATYLQHTLASLQTQTRAADEIIVVDDGSDDGSADIARAAGVRVIASPQRGVCAARNFGFSQATGDALMFLDADDLLAPDTLQSLTDALDAQPGAIAICPWFRLESENRDWVPRPPPWPAGAAGHDDLSRWLAGIYFPPCSVLWSRDAFQRTGGWDERALVNNDGDIMMRALVNEVAWVRTTRGAAFYRRVPLADGSVSSRQFSEAGRRSQIYVTLKIAAMLEDRGDWQHYRSALGDAFDRIAWHCRRDYPHLHAECRTHARHYGHSFVRRKLRRASHSAWRRVGAVAWRPAASGDAVRIDEFGAGRVAPTPVPPSSTAEAPAFAPGTRSSNSSLVRSPRQELNGAPLPRDTQDCAHSTLTGPHQAAVDAPHIDRVHAPGAEWKQAIAPEPADPDASDELKEATGPLKQPTAPVQPRAPISATAPQLPTVSVIIPVFNREHEISRAIDSVLAQTRGDFELLVIDDGSTDATGDVVRRRTDARIRYLSLPQNRGVAAARNVGMRTARGRYIAFLDSDDAWFPHKLQRQVEVFERAPEEVGVLYCGAETLSPDGERWIFTPYLRGDLHKMLLLNNHLHAGASGAIMRRNVLRVAGFFDESIPAIEDFDYWLRVSRFMQFDYVAEPLFSYFDVRAKARRSLDIESNLQARKWFFRKHLREMRRAGVAHEFLLASARRHVEAPHSDVRGAVMLALHALRQRPLTYGAWSFVGRHCVPAPLWYRLRAGYRRLREVVRSRLAGRRRS